MKRVLYVLLLVQAALFAQDEVTVDLSSPQATVYTHLYFLQADSYAPAKAASTIYGLEGAAAEQVAIKLKKILDGKGLKVDLASIPATGDYRDSTDQTARHRFVLFPAQLPAVSLERIENRWYYSKRTVAITEDLYREVYPWYMEKIQSWIPDFAQQPLFGIALWQYAGLLLIFLACVLLFHLLRRIVYLILRKLQLWIVHRSNEPIIQALKSLTRPIVLLLLLWLVGKLLPSLLLPLELNAALFLGLNIMVIVYWIYVFLKLVTLVMQLYKDYTARTHNKLDDQLVPIVHNFLRGIIIFAGVIQLLTLFGVDPVTVLAGASIGGLAVALASQDTVKNLIGTVMIFVDKPFHIGDWIEAGSFSGTVETVGFRSTRVRAADTAIFQIPNSALSEMVINNKGLRAYRRYQTHLGLRYDTPAELIQAFVKGVEQLIEAHPTTRKDAYNVAFTGFGDSSLQILVNLYFTRPEWGEEQAAKHALHLAILNLAKVLGVDFAFPSSTLMIEQFPEKSAISLPYKPVDADTEARVQQIVDALKKNSNQ